MSLERGAIPESILDNSLAADAARPESLHAATDFFR
jgi:hypothetical protein